MSGVGDGVHFRRINRDDLPLLHRWLNQDFVNQWYNDGPATLAEIEETYLPYIEGTKPTLGFVIYLGERPIGYVQTYRMRDYPSYQEAIDYREEAAGVDIFIGEREFIHRGYGSTIIRQFIAEVVQPAFHLDKCVLGPEPENKAAIRAYEKAGFRHLRTGLNKDEGKLEYLMELALQER